VYTVPEAIDPQALESQSLESDSVDPESPFATEGPFTQPDSTANQWRLRTEDGNVYGPVDKTEIDAWLTEGRITVGCHLQRDGSPEWTPATTVYPVLTSAVKQTSTNVNPFADGTSANPYTAPRAATTGTRSRYQQPHRGGLILVLGVMGLVCCNLLSIVAWVMGNTDLAQIREGRMDPAGRGLTQAGMVLGIIGTVLLGLQGIFLVISVIAS
jgi:hypothetical protein